MTPRRASWMLSDRVKKFCSGCGSATIRAPRFASAGPRLRSLVAGQPQRVRRHRVVGAADHLELEVGDDRVERHRRTFDEVRAP